MTNWECWLAQQKNRKEIICAVYGYHNNGKCGKDCILFPICRKDHEGTYDEFIETIDNYLDSEVAPTTEAVIFNLEIIKAEACARGFDGYVKTLERAIELLKEG